MDKKQQEIKNRREQIRYRNVMGKPEARAWVWQLLADCGVYKQTFNTDPGVTAFNEGRRSVGLQILAGLHDHCHDLYQMMETEHRKRPK